MWKILAVAVVALFWAVIDGAHIPSDGSVATTMMPPTTNHTGTMNNHSNHAINDFMRFRTTFHNQLLLMSQGQTCYGLYLDMSQHNELRSPGGLARLELHMISLIGMGGKHLHRMTDDEIQHVQTACGKTATHFVRVSQTL